MRESIHPQTMIGHVHLKVSDLDRAVEFYTEVLGFDVISKWGTSAAFRSAGGYHHHLGLNTWESLGGSPRTAPQHGIVSLCDSLSVEERTRTSTQTDYWSSVAHRRCS